MKGQRIGYIRVSSFDQNPDRQLDGIATDRNFIDRASGKSIECLYMLDYIDRKDLRQFVQQALNRGEAYHQLRRAIGNLNGDQLRGGSDFQIEQWNDCARLIANCIIYYNSALLSSLVERFEKQKNDVV